MQEFHCVKSDLFRSFSGPYSLAFGLNTEIYRINPRFQSECGEIQTRKKSVMDIFHPVFHFVTKIEKYLKIFKNIYVTFLGYPQS